MTLAKTPVMGQTPTAGARGSNPLRLRNGADGPIGERARCRRMTRGERPRDREESDSRHATHSYKPFSTNLFSAIILE